MNPENIRTIGRTLLLEDSLKYYLESGYLFRKPCTAACSLGFLRMN